MTTRTYTEHRPNATSSADDFFKLDYGPLPGQYFHLPHRPADTIEDKDSTDRSVADILGESFQGRSRWIACDDSSTQLVQIIRSMGYAIDWPGQAESKVMFDQSATSFDAEPNIRAKFTIMGTGSAPPDATRYFVESATDVSSLSPEADLPSQVEAIFAAAEEETFEYGMDSGFAQDMHAVIRRHGIQAIDVIGRLILTEQFGVEVGGEALRQIGSADHIRSHSSRLALLLRALVSPDLRLRDAASIGIATMDDPSAIEVVRRAVQRESSSRLKHNIQLVLDQLEETQRWLTS